MIRTLLSGLAASTIWSRENPLFPVKQVSDNASTPQAFCKCVIMLVLDGMVFFCVIPRTAAVQYLITYSFVSFLANCAFVTRMNQVIFANSCIS